MNFPITGPVFSGPQEKPFICSTENFKLPDGSTLGAAARRELLGQDSRSVSL